MAVKTAGAALLGPRLVERRPLLMAGVFDALSAVLAERAGYEALFLSGSALALTQLGRPDVGLVTLTELADVVARVCARVDVPVLVDADHGFGTAINVSRAVQVLERAGAAGIQLEDRVEAVAPRDLDKRPVVAADVMVGKIRAALDARSSAGTVISARTDALYSRGLEDAMDRAQCFAEAGADMVFVEGCVADADRRRVTGRLAPLAPLLFNASILDPRHLPPYAELRQLGYTVILFPATAAAAAAAGMQKAFRELQGWASGEPFLPEPFDASASIASGAFMERFR